MRLVAVLILMMPAIASGQVRRESTADAARPRGISWYDMSVLIAQDSNDVLLLLKADSALAHEKGGRTSYESFDPQAALAWIPSAREFLRNDLGKRDTGDVHTSRALHTRRGSQIFLVRRRYNGAWTYERFLTITDSARGPALLELGETRIHQLLDSLEAFARAMPRRPR